MGYFCSETSSSFPTRRNFEYRLSSSITMSSQQDITDLRKQSRESCATTTSTAYDQRSNNTLRHVNFVNNQRPPDMHPMDSSNHYLYLKYLMKKLLWTSLSSYPSHMTP